jgi:hypothetical protein
MERLAKMDIKMIKSVDQNKAASKLCKQLFPAWTKPPTQGELTKIIIKSWARGATNQSILKAGQWWLFIRNLLIENTITKQEKWKITDIAVSGSLKNACVNIISTRSPELLHAQIANQGDEKLPRSQKAFEKIAKIHACSSSILPTKSVIIFADLAVDNINQIAKVCNVNAVIEENIQKLKWLAIESGLTDFTILKMSEISLNNNKLGELINIAGEPAESVQLSAKTEQTIDIVAKESMESHKRMFGWTAEESRSHTRKLAITMGMVGQAINKHFQNSILIHNEAFITRGRLNNIFNPNDNPLPVICLRDLLESKKDK